MSKKKAPALHERRGREDISTRPPRLAGYPIKLAGKCPFAPAVSGSGFVREPKVLWRGPRRRSTDTRIRTQTLHTLRPGGAGRVFRSVKSWARTKATLSGLRLVRNLRKTRPAPPGRSYVAFAANPRVRWPARPTHNAWVGGLMCCIPEDYKVEMKVDRRWRPSSKSWSETQ